MFPLVKFCYYSLILLFFFFSSFNSICVESSSSGKIFLVSGNLAQWLLHFFWQLLAYCRCQSSDSSVAFLGPNAFWWACGLAWVLFLPVIAAEFLSFLIYFWVLWVLMLVAYLPSYLRIILLLSCLYWCSCYFPCFAVFFKSDQLSTSYFDMNVIYIYIYIL